MRNPAVSVGSRSALYVALLLGAGALGMLYALPGIAQTRDVEPAGDEVIATAGGVEITRAALEAAFRRSVRAAFYHGTPPRRVLARHRREVMNGLIERSLLLKEAERAGITPDRARVDASLDSYRRRYASSPQWRERAEELERSISRHLGEEDMLRQLESQVRAVRPPTETELSAYYSGNTHRFTEPAQHRLSLILLKVPPHSPREAWQGALARAADLVVELQRGADFAALAVANSDDASAAQGGDMGYLHTGMLSPAAQSVVESLSIGEISDPVRLLDGIAILRLQAHRPARQRPFEEVRARAEQLWQRDRSDAAWSAFKRRLVAEGPVHILDRSVLADLDADD